MKRPLYLSVLTLLLIAVVSASVLATAAVLAPSSFDSNGSPISGWYWLRAGGHVATWTFSTRDLARAKPGSVFLCMQALVTNGVSGGSGYETAVKMQVTGNGSQTVVVPLKNPYRPQDPMNSGGIGYITYGWGGPIKDTIWRNAQQITVTVAYPFPNSYHIAVADSGSLVLGYKY